MLPTCRFPVCPINDSSVEMEMLFITFLQIPPQCYLAASTYVHMCVHSIRAMHPSFRAFSIVLQPQATRSKRSIHMRRYVCTYVCIVCMYKQLLGTVVYKPTERSGFRDFLVAETSPSQAPFPRILGGRTPTRIRYVLYVCTYIQYLYIPYKTKRKAALNHAGFDHDQRQATLHGCVRHLFFFGRGEKRVHLD